MAAERGTGPRHGAILGLGGVARQSHLPAFRRDAVARRLTITAAVDPAHGGSVVDGLTVGGDVETLVDGPRGADGLAFVDIATPSASHVPLARWALARGIHVLCEKPVAMHRDDALALSSLARRHGAVLVPCHQYRFNPVWRRIRKWLADGALGHWHLAEIGVYRTAADPGAAPATATTPIPWRAQREAGGGVLADHGTHLLYTLLDLGGPPSHVQAWTGRLAHHDYDAEDTAQVRLAWDDRVATVFLTWAARRRETRVHIVGERGAIWWIDGVLTLERVGAVERYDLARELDKRAYADWFAELFLAFADAMDAGARGVAAERALADVLATATVLEAAHASAATGTTVAVPTVPAAPPR